MTDLSRQTRLRAEAMPADQRDTLIATAHSMADAAREAILPLFRQRDLATENKQEQGFDPVTVADRAAEQAMRDVLFRQRPGDGILGEEQGATPSQTGLTWVIDPIDGTRGFISGTPTWGVLIALCDEDGPLFGLIDQPYIGERFEGGFGRAQMTGPHGPGPLATRTAPSLEDAVLFTTFPEVGRASDRRGFDTVRERVKLTRYGMDCYAYALLASGHVDLVIEAGLNAYDIAAPIAVIEAAGGVVTDWTGGPVHAGGQVLATGSDRLHREVLSLLRPFADD